jgi:hypothetical protein
MSGARTTSLNAHDPSDNRAVVHIQLLHVPDCPLVERARVTLTGSLCKTNVRVTLEEMEGPYPSPMLLIDGVDVTGQTAADGPSCRLGLPTEDQVLAALAAAAIPVAPR